jgi:hypothetical protein
MEQSSLLATARNEFLRHFSEATQKVFPNCIEEFFIKADASYSSLEQGRLLDARSILIEKNALISDQLHRNLDALLTRSFRTTYDTFRPKAMFSTDSLTLMDPAAFEGDLRLEEITNHFRREAEEQLRDLNIRIALIFEQDKTSERENPFRPYLFSRCIANTFESLGLNPELTVVLVEQFSNTFAKFVPYIYDEVNNFFARNGIAAQLQLKVRKSGGESSPHLNEAGFNGEPLPHSDGNQFDRTLPPHAQSHFANQSFPQQSAGSSMRSGRDAYSNPEGQRTHVPENQVQSLFKRVRYSAAEMVNHAREVNQELQMAQNDMGHFSNGDASPSRFGNWLSSGAVLGDTLRKVFGSSIDATSAPQGLHASMHSHSDFSSGSDDGFPSSVGIQSQSGYETVDTSQKGGGGHFVPNPNLVSSIQQIQQTHTPHIGAMFDSQGAIRNLIFEQRELLSQAVENVDEQMTIDVVAMLFEYILRDPDVPAEVRAQLGRLQFLVLKLALRDPSFLTEKGHPARVLVNRIGSISVGLSQSGVGVNPITQEICRIVENLLKDETEDSEIFRVMLDEFDLFIARSLRAGDEQVEKVIEVAEQVRNRTLRFAHTTGQLGEALQNLTIDPFLKSFFETIWVYAIELADREDVKRAHRYRLLVPDLLWSIIPKQHEEERTQLLALLGVMLKTLREGLASIKCSKTDQDAVMNWLVDAHTKVMRVALSNTMTNTPSLSTIHNHFKNFFVEPNMEDFSSIQSNKFSETNKFLEEAIHELDIKVQFLDESFVSQMPPLQGAENLIEEKNQYSNDSSIQERLKNGVAIEMNIGMGISIGRLNWVDPAHGSLVLTFEGKQEPSIVSVRMFKRMYEQHRIRFIENEPLFERAVHSLLVTADKEQQSQTKS